MPEETISFSVKGNGFNSFHSYIPDWMVSMNNVHYTFKDGDMYEHNSNAVRNAYYVDSITGDPANDYYVLYDSTITPVFNEERDTVKVFNTIALDSTAPWHADITTEMSDGVIDESYYSEKEGAYFAYIRRDPDTIDPKAISTQGVGTLGSYAALVLTFGYTIGAQVSVGDDVYISDGTTLDAVGAITALTTTTITVDAAANVPVSGDMIVIAKDSTAESYGARGHYMQVKLTNSDTTEVELSTISSEAFKSYP